MVCSPHNVKVITSPSYHCTIFPFQIGHPQIISPRFKWLLLANQFEQNLAGSLLADTKL